MGPDHDVLHNIIGKGANGANGRIYSGSNASSQWKCGFETTRVSLNGLVDKGIEATDHGQAAEYTLQLYCKMML